MTGYMHPDYAESLAEFGAPRELPRSGGWILVRRIPGFSYCDAMGCYPLFACRDWSQLFVDLEDRGGDLVSLALVTDPFGEYDEASLRKCFRDVVIPFKDHVIADLSRSINDIVSKHHRYYSRKVLENVSVEECHNPTQFLEEWVDLYASLAQKHNLKGIKAFSRTAFAKQLSIPGLVMFRALTQDTMVGAHLWYVSGNAAYSHLAAFSSLGYDLMVSYALYWSAIEYFADKVRWLDLGGGAGIGSNGADGLSRFKRGWSTGTRPAYFCGRIFNAAGYAEILKARDISAGDYFPAYRKGEYE